MLSAQLKENLKQAMTGALLGLGIAGYAVAGLQVYLIRHPMQPAKQEAIQQAPAQKTPEEKAQEEEAARARANSRKGSAFSLDYEVLNCRNNPEAGDAIDVIGRLPSHYLKILYLQGARMTVASSENDLPEDLKKLHDASLAAYRKELGTDKLCGIAVNHQTIAMMNVDAVTLLHCGPPAPYSLHEMGHAFDVSAAYLMVPGGTELSGLPAFQDAYCRTKKARDPKADCQQKMPNGVPEYKEAFAWAFSDYYMPGNSRERMRKNNPLYYDYMARLEKSTLQRLIEINQ